MVHYSYYILIFLVGLSLGSFFNVIIFRFNTSLSPLRGRSKCLSCGAELRWWTLIPLLSYFLIKGRCISCKRKISLIYPVVEFATAVILTFFFIKTGGISYLFILNGFILLLFFILIFLDIFYFIIPDKILLLIASVIISLKFFAINVNFINLLISALGLTSFFAILFLVSKGKWIGLGDIKLIFLMGLLFGYPLGYFAIVLSVWSAAIFSMVLLVLKRATAKTEIPFGAFLSISSIIFIIFNHEFQEIFRYFY